ncbi:hypothetical protein [Diaphorobacter caeni]|uniref:hypothetical protein n=1 Tax=Diaphorobacter caeni TaxID=2784387 RepID=UPI00188FFE33|nr:hypothetical protein [Diaphorobacter caeni]MBF5003208.1 hypothetical protein [Diaphorobacter caeni]
MSAAKVTSFALLLTVLASGAALAQTPSAAPAELSPAQVESLSRQEAQEEQAEGRKNQRIERLTVEDGGSRVDELRVGGQTKSITVKPKSAEGGIPEYEVIPNNGVRDAGPSKAGADSFQAPRVWTLRKF